MNDIIAVGVDGCPGCWIAATLSAGKQFQTQLVSFDSIESVIRWRFGSAPRASCGVDVPIGLHDRVGFRQCDLEARVRLGSRKNSVFQVPDRSLLDLPSHEAIRAAIAQRKIAEPTALGISVQTFCLFPKIR